MGEQQIDNATRTKLETLLDMSGGYVLDFSNASFAAFVETCRGFDPYGSLRRLEGGDPAKDLDRGALGRRRPAQP